MYAGFVVLVVGTALLLGSWWGLAAGAVMVVGVARRAVLEERVLQGELAGYADYLRRVKYRFVPGIW
jgi:protein-S-isoprenylcysteine O-methyltransferase Ste14